MGGLRVFKPQLFWACLLTEIFSCRSVTQNTGVLATATPQTVNEADLTTYEAPTTEDYRELLSYLNRGGSAFAANHAPQQMADYTETLRKELYRLFPTKEPFFKGIPLPELYAIRLFKVAGNSLNEHLWDLSNPQKRDIFAGVAKAAASGLNRLPNFIGPVSRGTTMAKESVVAKYRGGEVVQENQFLSGSFSRRRKGNVEFVIHAKTGKRVDWLSWNAAEGDVLFTPGNKFFVHGITMTVQQRGAPVKSIPLTNSPTWESLTDNAASTATPGGDQSFKVVLEQIFPDSDSEFCCSLDEQWDSKIRACRYKFDPVTGNVRFPYPEKAFADSGEDYRLTQKIDDCSEKQLANYPNHTPRRFCGEASCYLGVPELNMITESYTVCRKDRRLNRNLDFYHKCSETTSDSDLPYWGINEWKPDRGDKTNWDAFRYRIGYEKKELETCAIGEGKASLRTGDSVKVLPLSAIAMMTGSPDVGRTEYWIHGRRVAAALQEMSPQVTHRAADNISQGTYYYGKIFGPYFAQLHSQDSSATPNGVDEEETGYADESAKAYQKAIDLVCDALQGASLISNSLPRK